MFSRRSDSRPSAPSHNNSQHVLAIVQVHSPKDKGTFFECNHEYNPATTIDNMSPNRDVTPGSSVLEAFSKTSALPIAVREWPSTTKKDSPGGCGSSSILLASNYPDCILEGENFCVLSAGFPYHYRDAFSSKDPASRETETTTAATAKTFARTVLEYCEAQTQSEDTNKSTIVPSIEEAVGRCLKRVSGHFSLFLVHKQRQRLWAWNDPFGFMPVYHYQNIGSGSNNNSEASTAILTSHWDCLVPAIRSFPMALELDWDIVAEYLTLGTTLGGGGVPDEMDDDDSGFDRTFVRGIKNLRPGICLSIEVPIEVIARTLTTTAAAAATSNATKANNDNNGRATIVLPTTLRTTTKSYIACYGACEELFSKAERGHWKDVHSIQNFAAANNSPELSLSSTLGQHEYQSKHDTHGNSPSGGMSRQHHIRGVKVAPNNQKKKINLISPLPSSTPEDSLKNTPNDNRIDHLLKLYCKVLAAVAGCVEEAVGQGHVGRAALTGGGDTRLILACLLRLFQQEELQQGSGHILPTITFQTHSKQKTDWQIARYLASTFRLKHERIRPIGTKISRFDPRRRKREGARLSQIHYQTPLRQPQKRTCDRYKEDTLQYTLHGRFGTEFLGCLCYYKSPLDIRSRDHLEEFRSKATRWFRVMFRCHNDDDTGPYREGSAIRNPVVTLEDRFQKLETEREVFEKAQSTVASQRSIHDIPTIVFDVGYAFQLQLYTRAFLSDIYKGLRGGSWFSMPTAQFTHNEITPFLDNTLLQTMLCSIATHDKDEPYELYGKLYQFCSSIPAILLAVPSNNKLLCIHTNIPRAIKASESKARPYYPECVATHRTRWYRTSIHENTTLKSLRKRFHPAFWEGAITVFGTGPMNLDVDSIGKDPRDAVRSLVELVGSAEDACLLSGRLQSFLLWYERRFFVHFHQH